MSVLDTLNMVTDRAGNDLSRIRALIAQGYDNMTDAERAEFLLNSKGAYNASDLNRVNHAMNQLVAALKGYGYLVPDYVPFSIIRPDIVTTTVETKTGLVDKAITDANLADYFEVTNGSYYFAYSDGAWTSNNGSKKSSTASTVFKAKVAMPISFNYVYGTEANYDKFTLKVSGTTVASAVSGVGTKTAYTGTLAVGDTIELTYTKDDSGDQNGDSCTLSDLVTQEEQTYEEVTTTTRPDTRDKYTWFEDDNPTAAQMQQYLDNVAAIRSTLTVFASTPETPGDMQKLTYEEANNIEKILLDIDAMLVLISRSWYFSGELFAGEV